MPDTPTNSNNLFDSLKYLIPFILGIISTLIFKRWDNRLIYLKKRVTVQRLGFSVENQNWGDLTLLYNGTPSNSIYAVSIEIINNTNHDCDAFNFDFALPPTCIIYQHKGQLLTNGLTLDLSLEEDFFEKFSDVKKRYNDYAATADPTKSLPQDLKEEVVFITRHRKFEVSVFNRGSELLFEFLVENSKSTDITLADVSADIFKKGIKVVPYLEEEKRIKQKKGWTEYGGLIIFLISTYPIYRYSHSVAIAVSAMILSLFVSSFLGLGIYHLARWFRKQFMY